MSWLSIFFFWVSTFSMLTHNSTSISLLHHKIIIILMHSRQLYFFPWIIFTYRLWFNNPNIKIFKLMSSFSTFKIRSTYPFGNLSYMASCFIFRLIFILKCAFKQLKSFIYQCFINFESTRSSRALTHVSYLWRLKIWLHSSSLILRLNTALTMEYTVGLINNFPLIIYLLTSWVNLIRNNIRRLIL